MTDVNDSHECLILPKAASLPPKYALSIQQPFASLIIDHTKRIENRTWKPPRKVWGQRIAIHASKAVNAELDEEWEDVLPSVLPRGRVIGDAIVSGVICAHPDDPSQPWRVSQYLLRQELGLELDDLLDWWIGPVGWILADVRKYNVTWSAKGKLGIWPLEARG